jgi:acetyltransferase-like isoleucine patch superfamily enzyme
MLRSIVELIKGWLYLLTFISGGNFIRKAHLKSCGKRVQISPTAFFKFPEQISIGDDTFINHLCSIWASAEGKITIGRDVLLGPGTTILSSNHGITVGKLIRLQQGQDADVSIGNDVWIGAHVVVTPGVTIGDGCVVGAGAVVTRNLPPNTVCGGVPARVIKERI